MPSCPVNLRDTYQILVSKIVRSCDRLTGKNCEIGKQGLGNDNTRRPRVTRVLPKSLNWQGTHQLSSPS